MKAGENIYYFDSFDIVEATIERVGRKYFYTNTGVKKWNIKTMTSDNNQKFKAYFSKSVLKKAISRGEF